MLAGFLSVLKIIGIVLLCILAFLLVLLLLVLFVPIFYRADLNLPRTEFEDGFDIQKIRASAKFSWLLFVIRGGIEFPENKSFTLRVFGIKILPRTKKSTEEGESADNGKKKEESGKTESAVSEETESVSGAAETSAEVSEDKTDEEAGTGTESSEESVAEGEAESSESAEQGPEGENADKPDNIAASTAEEEDEKSFLDVLWSIFDAIDNFLKTPLNVLEKIQYTISRVCGKIDMIKCTLENDIFKRAFDLVKRKLIKVIKMILPDKIDVDLLLGTGDPAQTAEIMGAFGALYPILYKKVRFTPDFESGVVETDAHIKGHITVFTIVYSAAVCFFNKDVRKTIRRFKKIIES